MATNAIVIGLDGGGTYTRALAADLTGQVLAQAQTGGANPSKNADAEANLQAAIRQVIAGAGRSAEDVVALVAGIAGLDDPEDQCWAERFTTLPGVPIKPTCVNDAVIAWAGALALQPGIVVIAGTGCILFGVTETGRQVRSYDFNYYANGQARALTFDLVFRLLAGEAVTADRELVEQVLAHFGVVDVSELAEQAARNAANDSRAIMRLYGDCAPLITAAAQQGIPLACAACNAVVTDLVRGVRLLGRFFTGDVVNYSLIGSVVRSVYIQQQLSRNLMVPAGKTYRLLEPAFPPERGALLLALQQQGIAVTAQLVKRLGDWMI